MTPGCKMVELLVLLGLHIDYPSDTLSSRGLREVNVLLCVLFGIVGSRLIISLSSI